MKDTFVGCCAVLFLSLCLHASAQSASPAESSAAPLQQTFESCPRGERPCGPVCMSKTFSCCDKAMGTICPPEKSCCGLRCGCGPCQTCDGDVCRPKPNCKEEAATENSSAGTQSTASGTELGAGGLTSVAVPAGAMPAAAAAGVGILGAALNTGSDERRRQISP